LESWKKRLLSSRKIAIRELKGRTWPRDEAEGCYGGKSGRQESYEGDWGLLKRGQKRGRGAMDHQLKGGVPGGQENPLPLMQYRKT